MKKKEIDGIMENKTLLNILSPIGGIEYKKNYIRVGDYLGRVYVITKYPQKVRVGWLENIANIPNTVCCLNISPTEKDTLMQNISRGIKQNESQYEGITDEILRQRTEREIQDARDLIEKVDLNGETVVYVTIAIMVIAEDEEELKQRSKAVLTRLTSMQMKGRLLTNLSKNSLKLMSPFSITDPVVKNIADRNMLESTWIGGLPFSSSGFNDGNKYYFARDTKGGIVILDPWKRGGDRTNSNFVIMGTAGVGKSTVAKHLILNEYMTNTKAILIDPEREEKEMVEKLGEKWIDVGSGKGGIINPLQIKKVPLDDEEADEVEYKSKGMGAMALHFQTLRTFFKLLYPELDSIHIARLEEVLEELYNRFNIDWDTDISGIPNNKFPIMTDLYNLLGEKASNEIDEEKQKIYDTLRSLLRGISIGAEKGLFNGYTSIDDNAKIVCFDTFNLQNADDKVKRAQYFNILTYCWEIMSKDKEEKTMLVCDEAYLLIDPRVPETTIFLRNVAKRCRKYEGSLVIISHSIVDFLDDSIKMYGQAILDMATYKILMGTDGVNLEETTELFKLSEGQSEFLYKKKRGLALFIIGSNRIFVRFDIFPIEFEYFGKGGGR